MELTIESAQRQGTANLVGSSARRYSGNAIPIMVIPEIGNATCKGTSPVRRVCMYLLTLQRDIDRETHRDIEAEIGRHWTSIRS